MAIPANVMTQLQSLSQEQFQHNMTVSEANIVSAGNIMRHVAATQMDELQPAEARAVDKVLQLPK